MISRGSIALFGDMQHVIDRYFFNIIKVKYLRKIDDNVFVGLSFGNLIIVKTKIDLRKNNQKIAFYFL